MKVKKTYYSISEVSKMLDIPEHTIRYWNSKLPEISKRSDKGKTKFFTYKQIEKLSNINDILKNNDSLSLANKIVSRNINKKSSIIYEDSTQKQSDSVNIDKKISKLKAISNNLKDLILEK